jgi:hypothetical protein
VSSKIFRVLIEALVVDPTDPRAWSREELISYLGENPGMVVKAVIEEGVFTSSGIAPGHPPPSPDPQGNSRIGVWCKKNRPVRERTGTDTPEYMYRSADYIAQAGKLRVGRVTVSKGRRCVWLTVAEIIEVTARERTRNVKRRDRRRVREAKVD